MARSSDVLEAMKLYEGVYLVGGFVVGVTVRKQQIRALNLVWALKEAKVLSNRVAVIGGGVAGVTTAAALTRVASGLNEIFLFEQRPSLCPLQRGCDTRWLHPQIYDWPAADSQRRTAGLPIMNWREGRASDVVHQLLREWDERKKQVGEQVEVVEVLGASHLRIDGHFIEWSGIRNDKRGSKLEGGRDCFDIIIVAVGFGEERGIDGVPVMSYWRNESYGQPELDRPMTRNLVSGTGDGGLVDLLRIRIRGFRQDTIIDELFGQRSKEVQDLIKLRDDFVGNKLEKTELYNRMQNVLHTDVLEELKQAIYLRLRNDTAATLQVKTGSDHKATVSSIFGQNASFLHNFLVFLLYRAGGFALLFGELGPKTPAGFDRIIVRHGTRRRENIVAAFSTDISINNTLNRMEEKATSNESDIASWPARFWDAYTGSAASWQQEYAPGATVVLASAFAAALEGVLDTKDDVRFRATLHRVIGDGDEKFLQQVAHYQGTRSRGGEPYRVFPAGHGIIGLSAGLGRAFRTVKPNSWSEEEYTKALGSDNTTLNLNEGGAQAMDSEVLSMFVCPVINDSTRSTLLVLFVDATKPNFFDEDRCLRLMKALQGLVRFLEHTEKLRLPELDVIPTQQRGIERVDDARVRKVKAIKKLSVEPPKTRLDNFDFEWRTVLPIF